MSLPATKAPKERAELNAQIMQALASWHALPKMLLAKAIELFM